MTARPPIAGIILAAGQGTRMKSDLPKGLHAVCGLPMVEWVVRAMRSAGVSCPVVVIGHGGDLVRASLGEDGVSYAEQTERLGTGHATLMARDQLASFQGPVVVAAGDTPLLKAETIARLAQVQMETGAAAVLATCFVDDPSGYGRILRDEEGRVVGIVEQKDATDEQRDICEINPAVYAFDAQVLWRILPGLKNENQQGEYYLTDMIAAVRQEGGHVEGVVFDDPDEFRGVNDRWQLAEAAAVMQESILRRHAESGVTIIDPWSTMIGADVEIGSDAAIYPNTVIEGKTSIGAGAIIGPNSWIKDSQIGAGCKVFMSHLERAKMASGSRIGPFSNLRPQADLGPDVKVGNFVEIKNATIGQGTSLSHLTYVGDASIGQRSNIGAGTITCNYDGFSKSRTQIGDDTFIGSNSTLIAPVTIGNESMVAAGSVVNRDIPDGAMGIGRAKQENKEGWFRAWRSRKLGKSE